ncbi:MAG: sulfurtransferase complex subunit TusB [Candidatus Heimdallarchaeota archaeon]
MEPQTSIVYLYGISPRQSDKLETLLKILREQIVSNLEINIVLIHDGVIGSTKKERTPDLLKEILNLPINVYSVTPDIKARGMDSNNLNDKIKRLEYDNLVDLLINVTKIVSWM